MTVSEGTKSLHMVDLQSQYEAIRAEVDEAIQEVIDDSAFIRGAAVGHFERELAAYLGGRYAVGVGNGTDALQIAFMALGIGPGDEVITTPFTFIATAEAAMLLGAKPVWVDIEPSSFNIDVDLLEAAITPRTRAIVPVHLFGRPADMSAIMAVADRHGVAVVEDNAQSIGSRVGGTATGYIGAIGCLSFFPSKNLGAFGDGGAVLTNDGALFERVRMIANHGSRKKYFNEVVGVNSRLDTMQAAILRVKLRHLDRYIAARQLAADWYDELLAATSGIITPRRGENGHVFHQYTIRVKGGGSRRDKLAAFLRERGIPTATYYPVPLHRLPVFAGSSAELPEAECAADEVLSLPMHTELHKDQVAFIAETIDGFLAS
jgi:UDP-2-acetamido-2-deoxy-ribo-hexuluronate aminotransferase